MFLSREAMGAMLFDITPLLLSISHSRYSSFYLFYLFMCLNVLVFVGYERNRCKFDYLVLMGFFSSYILEFIALIVAMLMIFFFFCGFAYNMIDKMFQRRSG